MFSQTFLVTAAKPNQIQYEYVSPKNPEQQAIHDQMKQGRTLEHLQELLRRLRLPYPLTLKGAGCNGALNAWCNDEVITLCYELLVDILKNALTQDLPIGISGADTIIGPVLAIFLHKTGHAVFNMLQIPVPGREEDAADQFAAYVTLRLSKDEARKMILGTAYQHKLQMPGPKATMALQTFPTSTRRRRSGRTIFCASAMARTRSCLPTSSKRTSCPRDEPRFARENTRISPLP